MDTKQYKTESALLLKEIARLQKDIFIKARERIEKILALIAELEKIDHNITSYAGDISRNANSKRAYLRRKRKSVEEKIKRLEKIIL